MRARANRPRPPPALAPRPALAPAPVSAPGAAPVSAPGAGAGVRVQVRGRVRGRIRGRVPGSPAPIHPPFLATNSPPAPIVYDLVSVAEMGSGRSEARRVLIVDDEILIGRVLARALGGFAVVDVAQSGAEALQLIMDGTAAGSRFDLVVCDVMMPEMSGPELYDRVKAIDPRTAAVFVFVTGGASQDQLSRLSATGARYLQKPLDVDAILSLLVS